MPEHRNWLPRCNKVTQQSSHIPVSLSWTSKRCGRGLLAKTAYPHWPRPRHRRAHTLARAWAKRDVARDVAAHGQFPVKAVAETLGTLDLVERLARHAKSNHGTGGTRTALLR